MVRFLKIPLMEPPYSESIPPSSRRLIAARVDSRLIWELRPQRGHQGSLVWLYGLIPAGTPRGNRSAMLDLIRSIR